MEILTGFEWADCGALGSFDTGCSFAASSCVFGVTLGEKGGLAGGCGVGMTRLSGEMELLLIVRILVEDFFRSDLHLILLKSLLLVPHSLHSLVCGLLECCGRDHLGRNELGEGV